MKKILLKVLVVLSCWQSTVAVAQQPPFRNEIDAFQKADSAKPPPQNGIVFIGSSSFRLWPDLPSYFPSHANIINRGFGGATFPDLLRYEQETIFKYNPRQVVIYCGDNDLAASDTASAVDVYGRFVKLFAHIRLHLPKAWVLFVSIKPSPSRWPLRDKAIGTNELIKKFLSVQKRVGYADVWLPMLDAEGKPMEGIFKEDKLHMKPDGYAIWAKVIEPLLK